MRRALLLPPFPRDSLKRQEFLLPGYSSRGVGPEPATWAGPLPSGDQPSGRRNVSKRWVRSALNCSCPYDIWTCRLAGRFQAHSRLFEALGVPATPPDFRGGDRLILSKPPPALPGRAAGELDLQEEEQSWAAQACEGTAAGTRGRWLVGGTRHRVEEGPSSGQKVAHGLSPSFSLPGGRGRRKGEKGLLLY